MADLSNIDLSNNSKKSFWMVFKYFCEYLKELIFESLKINTDHFRDYVYQFYWTLPFFGPLIGIFISFSFFGVRTTLSLIFKSLLLICKLTYYIIRCLVLLQLIIIKLLLYFFEILIQFISKLSDHLYILNQFKKKGNFSHYPMIETIFILLILVSVEQRHNSLIQVENRRYSLYFLIISNNEYNDEFVNIFFIR